MRAVLKSPAVEPHVARTLRAARVRESARFWVREARGRGSYRYHVRETGQLIALEHGSTDVATFDQAFHQHAYEPSAAADAALRGLGHPLRALDLGANIGMFSVWLAARYDLGHTTCVEPLPRNVDALRVNLSLALQPGTYTVSAVAAGAADGTATFGGADATNGFLGGGDLTVEVRDVFTLLDGLDLLKLDIEGGEWPIVADPRFGEIEVPVVMFEHHPGADAPPDPPSAAEQALRAAGYTVERTEDGINGAGVVWGVR